MTTHPENTEILDPQELDQLAGITPAENPHEPGELLTELQDDTTTPRKTADKLIPRLLAGSAVSGVVIFVLLFMWTLFSLSPSPKAKQKEAPATLASSADDRVPELQSELAFNQQPVATNTQPAAQPTPTPTPQPARPTPAPTRSAPPVQYTRSYTPAPTPYRPAPSFPIPQRSAAPYRSAPSATPTPVDPNAWAKAAALGNYQGIPDDTAIASAPSYTPSTQLASQQEVTELPMDQPQYQSISNTGIEIPVGRKAAGRIETPIAWSSGDSASGQSLIVRLTEPLRDKYGNVAIPAESYLNVQVTKADNNGLITATVINAAIPEGGSFVEKPIPNGVIAVRGEGGRILQADRQGTGNGGVNLTTALLSGVGQIGWNSYGRSGRGRQNDPLTSIASGAAQNLTDQLMNQQQQSAQQQTQPYFALGNGKDVEIFVMQTFGF